MNRSATRLLQSAPLRAQLRALRLQSGGTAEAAAARRRMEPERRWRCGEEGSRSGGAAEEHDLDPLRVREAEEEVDRVALEPGRRRARGAVAAARGGASAVVGLPPPCRLHAASPPARRRGREEGRTPATASSGSGAACAI
ncbi:unnamed protein product [Urochloa humidicola]